MVDFPDGMEAGVFGALVGLLSDRAFEIRVIDVLREAAGDVLGFGGRYDHAPAVVGGRGFEDRAVEGGECLEIFQIMAHASADLKFFGFVG